MISGTPPTLVAMIGICAAAALYPKIAAGYAAQGRPETFEEFLNSILQDRPFDHRARVALARNRASHGQTKRAIEELSRAIEVAPHDLSLRAELGRQLLSSGQEGEALKGYADLLDAIERGPDGAPAAGDGSGTVVAGQSGDGPGTRIAPQAGTSAGPESEVDR